MAQQHETLYIYYTLSATTWTPKTLLASPKRRKSRKEAEPKSMPGTVTSKVFSLLLSFVEFFEFFALKI